MGKIHKRPKTLSSLWNHWFLFIFIAIISGLLVIFVNVQSFAFGGTSNVSTPNLAQNKELIAATFPTPQVHKLPSLLLQWQDISNSGDYFSQVKPTPVGYLIWSRFPVRIHITTPQLSNTPQAETWVKEVSQAVAEWNQYLPLQIVDQPEIADITIVRQAPPLKFDRIRKTTRARSALTTYNLYKQNSILYHRSQILLSPSQRNKYLLAAARHELGHALGIWGHSRRKSDTLYFSQVPNPPPISTRDINTLKRVYQQPTSLGWTLTGHQQSVQ